MSDLGEGNFFHLAAIFTAFLQLNYQTQTSLPTTVLVAVSSLTLYYWLYVLKLQLPRSRFAAVAHHLLFWSAYATVGSLAAAVFPPASTPCLYTIFGLILAGRMLYLFGDRLVINWGEDAEADGDGTWKVYKKRVIRFLKNMCRHVADFFRHQPNEPILPR